MATLLLKLRLVPDDELEDICDLLDQSEIEHYQTNAGNWGISMPALWLSNDEQVEQAQTLLAEYAEQRYIRVKNEQEELKQAGEARTFLDIAKEKPVQFILYLVFIGALIYISLVPFLSLGSGS